MRFLPLLLLAGCASSGPASPRLWIQRGDAEPKEVVFETRKFHPRTKVVRATTEGTPGRMPPPKLEAGEATIVYLHHYERASDALADDARQTTILLVFDHIPRTPWRVELPSPGVEVIWHEGGATGEVKGWVQVDEAAPRSMTVSMDVVVATAAGPVAIRGRVEADLK